MPEEDRASFRNMSWYFKRSNGILKDAINRWENGSIYEGDFWQVLELCIDDRIAVLATDKALYDQTIGDEK